MATYNQRECLICNKLVKEGAYSGRDGNWKKHCNSKEHLEKENASKK